MPNCTQNYPDPNLIKWSNMACAFAIICSLIGIVSNSINCYVISVRKSIRSQSIVPMIFYLSLSDLAICLFGLPVQASRFSKLSKCVPKQQCDMPWPLGKYLY